MNTNELKLTLTEIKNNHFQPTNNINLNKLTNAMLEHIGNTDPVLRDSLIYPTFSSFIINGYYPRPELNRILTVCLDDKHLFYKIGEVEGDAVFTRSFSSLIIAVLLHINLQNAFLSDEDIDKVADKLLDYVDGEQDVRGLVEGKGWAHSIAHIADTLDELVKQPQLNDSILKEAALSILDKMCFDKGYFLFEEDERMVIPMVSLLQRDLDQTFICEKIREIADDLSEKYTKDHMNLFIYRTNIKQFLKSLVLHLEVINQHEELCNHIKQALKVINQPYYNL